MKTVKVSYCKYEHELNGNFRLIVFYVDRDGKDKRYTQNVANKQEAELVLRTITNLFNYADVS